jgi:lipopolysaccharide/colanic/teichoic acid biosynthesis glycosyltransferase
MLDILISAIILVMLLPFLAVIAILVRVMLGTPILFKQGRPGKNEKIFILYKFRTMSDVRDASGVLLPDKDRMTKFGKILRRLSIDELPEFFNILKGDMSIIGPRPLLIKYLPYYYKNERIRHSVRPGITGLAQVCGRNFLSWDERFKKDVEYVDNLSFNLDLLILLRTIRVVLRAKDIVEYDNTVQCTLKNLDEERANGIPKN